MNRLIINVSLLFLLSFSLSVAPSLAFQPDQQAADSTSTEGLPGIEAPQQDTLTSGTRGSMESSANSESTADGAETSTPETDAAVSEVQQIQELISLNKIFYSLLILVITYFFNKYFSIVLDNVAEKATNYRLFVKRLAPISRIVIWSFAIYIVIAGVIDPPFETVIAIGASVGIAVGFASQDILKNIFGGVMIILDRPFQVGDKISVSEHYGEVLSIGLRSSRVVTPDDSIVSIPNAELMNKAVSNSNSSALDCQVVAEIYLPATVDVARVKELAMKAVYASPYTYLNKPVNVIVLNEIHEKQFVIKLRVKAYVLDIRYEFQFKSDVTEMIIEECNRLGLIPEPGSPSSEKLTEITP